VGELWGNKAEPANASLGLVRVGAAGSDCVPMSLRGENLGRTRIQGRWARKQGV
jgi:hypothetical protein